MAGINEPNFDTVNLSVIPNSRLKGRAGVSESQRQDAETSSA